MLEEKIVKKIDSYLEKKSFINYFSLKLISYDDNDIYVRFDYVDKIKAYRISWFDLKYIDVKHLDLYINSYMVTSYLANRMIEFLYKIKMDSSNKLDSNILGDRVEIINNISDSKKYVFDRYLPLEWSSLIDPLAMIFTYLPRNMEIILNEIFARYDNTVEFYNSKKPVYFDFDNDDSGKIFKRDIVIKGRRLEDRVSFLEKIDNKYIAIVDAKETALVIITKIKGNFYRFYSNIDKGCLDENMYAVVECIKDKKFKNFYKVRYKNKKNRNLLDEVRKGEYYCSFGVDGDNILLISVDGNIVKIPILEDGKVVFDVIEDDDDLSLSKILNEYK